MRNLIRSCCLLAALAAGQAAPAVTAVEQWGGDGHYAHPNTMTVSEDGQQIRFDLSALPRGAKLRRARLVCFREPPPADTDQALVEAQVLLKGTSKPLELIPPWYDGFAVPAAALKGKQAVRFEVKAFPGWIREKTFLEIACEDGARAELPAAKGVTAFHQAGQTFITWQEIEKVVEDDRPTWGRVKQALEGLDAKRRVRYRVYRSDKPITADGLADATLLAEIGPLSCYNLNGRSPDQAFHIMRKRMLVDMDYAKMVSRRHYAIPASAHNEVVIDRLVIPGSPAGRAPLAGGTGLYVHHPAEAGRGYYAVTVVVNGRENTWALQAGRNVFGPVAEKPGSGRPVFQREMDMKVLFDYPGRRIQYVQWCAPPLANLPNQYYNWSVFVPEGVKHPAPLELVLTGNGMFRRPRWPHRPDTVLVSPQDTPPQAPNAASGAPAPADTFYFGYHESCGTLRSLSQGTIQPYTWRRMLAFVDWACEQFKVNRSFVVCSGDRGHSATAALQFGMRHPQVFSLVYTCKGMPNPAAIPAMAKLAGWHPRKSKTEVWHLQRLVGRKDLALKMDTDEDVWEFLNLTKLVAASPEVVRPMLSYGGRGGWNWPPIARFLQALAEARQPVISEGTWGAVNPPGLRNPGRRGTSGLNVYRGRPIPVFANHSGDYQGGRNGDGGQTNYGVWWDDLKTLDGPDRLEMTIVGGGTVDVTPRRMKKFLLKPGEKVRYQTQPAGRRGGRKVEPASGEVVADALGLVTVPKVLIPGATKLILTRSGS